MERPQNVGILAMEVYFPPSYVEQGELEAFDGVSTGKYTIGLGQERLAFCTDVEDVISMSLTVVKSLLEKYGVSRDRIGRLEVGSETVLDKSKSIKSSIMELFEGCNDIEGVDSTNACYGGTAALFNSMNWVESSAWDGRYALVVASDSAVYAEGPARPTGGAGAVAMLIGPDAPIAMERSFISSHMSHVYDFYKPNLASEYPVVDSKLTQVCYLGALDTCYNRFCSKFQKKEGKQFGLADFDFLVCHSPYNKLVQKSFSRLLYGDYLHNTSLVSEDAIAKLEPFATLSHKESLANRDLEKALQQLSQVQYKTKVGPTTLLPKQIGNMYCASLYAGLATLLNNQVDALVGKRVLAFSYGSGLASSMFSFRLRQSAPPFSIPVMAECLDIPSKLTARKKVTPEEFASTMHLMESRYGAKDFVPVSSRAVLSPGTFYLTEVDARYRRYYARIPLGKSRIVFEESLVNGNGVAH